MIYINNLETARPLFEALASPTRTKIIELLQQTPDMNMDTLAKSLGITNGALTAHIKKLSDCGIINVKLHSMEHGTQKLCSIGESKLVIDLLDKTLTGQYERLELNVGQYSCCQIQPTCGLCGRNQPLFDFDIPHYFKYPEHFNAELVWFCNGFITYSFPNPLTKGQTLTEVQISLELSSEGPFLARDYPAAIDFYNHDRLLGRHISPGEFDEHKGKLTPDWWFYGQYGEHLTISITESGTCINGLEASSYSIHDLLNDATEDAFFQFKISCEDQNSAKGGIMLFGKGFGDLPQGIVMKVFYR
ncbi:MAG: winged helix-turn-helix transcriptional regulator [Lachnospiraceae bacterium]|nr:winged helix-turn-helix transcriptional regulator [Lachnospiraceae bacterium]